jgi:Na+/H+-dicarboxylate symporter
VPAVWQVTGAYVLALITVFGYMLTDMGHYGVFKLPKYRTTAERFLFAATLFTVLGLIAKWYFFWRFEPCKSGEVRGCHLPSSCH